MTAEPSASLGSTLINAMECPCRIGRERSSVQSNDTLKTLFQLQYIEYNKGFKGHLGYLR